MDPTRQDVATLRDYLRVLRRRKSALAFALALFLGLTLAYTLRQDPLYAAYSDAFLSRQNLAQSLTGVSSSATDQDAERFAQTQRALAEQTLVARRVLNRLGLSEGDPHALLGASSVSVRGEADLLRFEVTNRDPDLAERLATVYAREFANYRRELDTATVEAARSSVQRQIEQLRRSGEDESAFRARLVSKEAQLRLLQTLQSAEMVLVSPADDVYVVQPRPVRNLILGLGLGVLFGLLLAFLTEAFDNRVRTAEEVEAHLGMPILAHLPAPPKRPSDPEALPTLRDPYGPKADAFRVLRTRLDWAAGGIPRVVMVTSAYENEGRSTAAANLAIAIARAGRQIVLVDLDLHSPSLARIFDIEDGPGITDVAVGDVSLDEALVSLPLSSSTYRQLRYHGHDEDSLPGALSVLTAGRASVDVDELLASTVLVDIIDELRARAGLVVDVPAVLESGDAMALSVSVDGILVVSRLQHLRRPQLVQLKRALAPAPVAKLGVAVIAATYERRKPARRPAPQPGESSEGRYADRALGEAST